MPDEAVKRLLASPWTWLAVGFVALLSAMDARTLGGRLFEWAMTAVAAYRCAQCGMGRWWDA